LDTGPQVSGVSSEKARASLKPMLREGFTTPDNVKKKTCFSIMLRDLKVEYSGAAFVQDIGTNQNLSFLPGGG